MSRTVVLFEGRSDVLAFQAAARRMQVRLGADVELANLLGITNLRRRLADLRVDPVVRVLGLYDGAEARYVGGVLTDSGLLRPGADAAEAGFYGCDHDLEDEVIAAAGPELVLQTLQARGELRRFRVFQGQPAQRERSIRAQLHRFAGTAGGRKARFAADIVAQLPVERMPRPFVALLAEVRAEPAGV